MRIPSAEVGPQHVLGARIDSSPIPWARCQGIPRLSRKRCLACIWGDSLYARFVCASTRHSIQVTLCSYRARNHCVLRVLAHAVYAHISELPSDVGITSSSFVVGSRRTTPPREREWLTCRIMRPILHQRWLILMPCCIAPRPRCAGIFHPAAVCAATRGSATVPTEARCPHFARSILRGACPKWHLLLLQQGLGIGIQNVLGVFEHLTRCRGCTLMRNPLPTERALARGVIHWLPFSLQLACAW